MNTTNKPKNQETQPALDLGQISQATPNTYVVAEESANAWSKKCPA